MAVRLLIEGALQPGATVVLTGDQHHYLAHVMRLTKGDHLTLINGRDGEWQAEITGINKREAEISTTSLIREQREEAGPSLMFAPIRRQRLAVLIEKAVELGVASLLPVTSQYCDARLERQDRIERWIAEAVEQSERLSVPNCQKVCTLASLLDRKEGPKVLVGLARRDAVSLPQALDQWPNAGLFVGPEGGFAPEEVRAMEAHPRFQTVRLAPGILRAETAAITMLAQWQAWKLAEPQRT